METNKQHYKTGRALAVAHTAICRSDCKFCRFSYENWPQSDPLWGGDCLGRFGASPYGAPADPREPWPPVADPNPL